MTVTRVEPTDQSVGRALIWMSGALASFLTVAVAGREAAAVLADAAGRDGAIFSDTVQLMFIRSVIGLLCVLIALSLTRQGFRQISFARFPLHGLRNTIHFAAQFSWLHALTLIPLAQLFSIEFTAPLWVAVLAPLILKERLTPARILAAAVGFCGVLVIVQPGGAGLDLGSALALFAALGFAGSMITTKLLTRNDTVLCILFHMSWTQAVAAGVIALPYMASPPPMFLFWASIVGLCGMTAHYALTRAFSEADAMVVAPMDFMRLPLITLIGALLYGESIDVAVLMGGLVVVCGNIINLIGERCRRR